MFNYSDLNDIEFEYLCQDILQKKLNTKLRRFAKGRDGGIDLTNDVNTNEIVVQVKHYVKSAFSNLRTSLKKEISKVTTIKPKQYYICCSKELTASNIKEIYNMFSDYMESPKNVITLLEIDAFLSRSENIDIVRKHYKLWLHASNILSEVHNSDVFLDCEVLLSDIKEDTLIFVQTAAYNKCLYFLERQRIVFIVGAPGVGKTMTSNMLILHFADQGYRVRYISSGSIENLKKSLSSDKDMKEIILLDDCFGQYYFSMSETQESEIVSLIKYISMNKNKIIILNSRVTIYNEAKIRSIDFKNIINKKKLNIHVINMDETCELEKAKMLYNHLYFKKIPAEYFNQIKMNKNYLKIIEHVNYSPRIVDFICAETNYKLIDYKYYFDYIIDNLNNPIEIWENEYTRKISQIDRLFLNTLFSVTNTNVEMTLLEKCFNYRIKDLNIDTTINHFEASLHRLNGSFVKIIDEDNIKKIGVLNPSVNDYLYRKIESNKTELDAIKETIISYQQIKKMYEGNMKEYIISLYETKRIIGFAFMKKGEKAAFITSQLCIYKIKDLQYKKYISKYFYGDLYDADFNSGILSVHSIVNKLAEEEMSKFYNIIDIINDIETYTKLIETFEINALEDSISLIRNLHPLYIKSDSETYNSFCNMSINGIQDEIEYFSENIDVSDYTSEYDMYDIIQQNRDGYEHEGVSIDGVIETISQYIADDVIDEIHNLVRSLPEELISQIDLNELSVDINTLEITNFVNDYIEGDRHYEYEHDVSHICDSKTEISEIEIIFDR